MLIERQTLARTARLAGLGLHSGAPVRLELRPADDGIHFCYDGQRYLASADNVTDTNRSTTLGPVRTVEHLMSALSGTGVTDVEVHTSAPEMPAMDGSALDFVEAITAAGRVDLPRVDVAADSCSVRFTDGSVEIDIRPGTGRWSYHYNSETLWPYSDVWVVGDIGTDYESLVGKARTFVRRAELGSLAGRGLAAGIDLSSALIVGQDGFETPSRLDQELTAHKMLDLVGDLYLTGIPARYLDVSATRSGHRTNVAAAVLYLEALQA